MADQASLPNTKKSISFKKTIRIRKVRHLDDFSSKEIQSCWYTPDETLDMKRETKAAVKVLDMSLDIAQTNDFCERGIEVFTKDGHERRIETRIQAWQAVSDAQEAQREQNVSDPEALAKAYREMTSASKVRALLVARNDAYQAQHAPSFSLPSNKKRMGIDPPRRVASPACSPSLNTLRKVC